MVTVARGDAAEGQGLGDVGAADLGRAAEVGDRARDPQHRVVATAGEMHALVRAQQKIAPEGRLSGRGVAVCHRLLRYVVDVRRSISWTWTLRVAWSTSNRTR
jgi:hypothetical protein